MCSFSLVLFLLAFSAPLVSSANSPNIILFVIDDLGWNDTSYQGSDIQTPNIDKLAEEGIRLKQYYVQPLCSPSRSALLAGKYPYHLGLAHGVITNGHPYGLGLNETTIADHLKKGGYSTHAVGKWDLGMHKWEFTPTYRGFDTFYGYYDADEDYYTHKVGGYLDFRNNTDPVKDEDGTYSTFLFTKAIEDAINAKSDSPFFIYGAYQSVHSPLEAPDTYLEKCHSPYPNRKIFCGMMLALDEGISNITSLLQTKGLLDDTIIILTTDNGGQTALGSSNWPLRGNKATVFEGGVRGISFVWSTKLRKSNYDNNAMMHITDWYPTIIEGIAGMTLDTKGLDGFNMWDTINDDTPSPRTEILHQLDPPKYDERTQFIGQAALRQGDWKLIIGQPNCSEKLGPHTVYDLCPIGWIHLNGTIEEPEVNPSLTWLFNVKDDPNERNELSASHPEIVSKLKELIEAYNATHIVQMDPPIDPRSDPKKFGNIWTPWLD
ncbi:PREDICTED: arylsulfatase B-like [Amphimedon queenslandica]|uniref:Sulfatase N-terminal domain-containing protein n=1 Tax=Amphimedon queenslandica TaxID=400682 RepID=A0A1X7TAG4_AMPQE|nr:PREDICTED: arylsulfatase B-like [Amphimedon queenslandica]|eukprot:XP_019860668.1 PREDICTED: arylsulfatase B-like [Amphimedon queenslandica]